jgi:hypothetical protein
VGTIYSYVKFARRFAQIRRIFYLSQALLMPECEISEKTKEDLVLLNNKRRNVQERAGEINSLLSKVCYECKGYCCLRSYEHYTVLEYWLRKYTSSPLQSYSNELLEPILIYLFRYRLNLNIYKRPRILQNGCPYLGDNGCSITVSERPIKCIAFTCRTLRKAMNKQVKSEYAKILKELYFICYDTFGILKREAGIPLSYGRLSLILTP